MPVHLMEARLIRRKQGKTRNKITWEMMVFMKGLVYPVCAACGEVPRWGLYDGFRLKGRFFCSECEQKILSAEVGSAKYKEYMSVLREALIGVSS